METNTYKKTFIEEISGSVLNYSINCDDKDCFLDVVDIGQFSSLPTGQEQRMYKHDFYLIVWWEQGEGTFLIDCESYEICANRLFFFAPGQCHGHIDINGKKGLAIIFNEAFLLSLDATLVYDVKCLFFGQCGNLPYVDVQQADLTPFSDIVRIMFIELHEKNVMYANYCASLLSIFFIRLKRLGMFGLGNEPGEYKPGSTRLFAAFQQLVEMYYTERLPVSFYAARLNCSESTLNRVVRSIWNEAPLKMINDRCLLEAKRLLCFTSMPVKEVAVRLGFSSQSYFTSFFYKSLQVSPQKFREEHQKRVG